MALFQPPKKIKFSVEIPAELSTRIEQVATAAKAQGLIFQIDQSVAAFLDGQIKRDEEALGLSPRRNRAKLPPGGMPKMDDSDGAISSM